MEIYNGKVGEIEVSAKLEGGKLVVQEAYGLEAGIAMLIDKIEAAIPGDQKMYAEMLKALVKEKLASA